EARRQAMLSAGGLTQAAESVRDRRGLPWVDGVAADLKYALRALRHSRAFTVIVVLTLALGIGANTAIFSVVRGVLLKPLPNRDGDRLVYLRQSADGPGQGDLDFSVPEVSDLRHGVPSLGGIAEYSPWSVVYQSDEGAVRISVGLITGNYFEIMGLSPVIGRLTRPSDDGPGVPGVAVLTHEYWMRRFDGDPSLVGKQRRFDNRLATVIGVLQPAPFYPRPIDARLNMVMSEHHLSAQMVQGRTHRMTTVVARLAPGATLQQARSEVASVYTRLQGEYKDAYDPASHYKVAVIPFHEVLGERARLTLWLLMGAAAFVLIIAVALLLSFLSSLPREGAFASWILAGGHRTSGGLRKHRLQRGLVVVQIAVSVVLLAGAGLLTRTMIRLADVSTGLRTEEILTMEVTLLTPNELLSNPAADPAAKTRYEQMRREIAALPGVVDGGLGSPVPLRASDAGFDVKAEGKTPAIGEALPR